jgi:branched-chain amino acid transport system substrate-binding protein
MPKARRGSFAATACALLLVAACGTRLPDEAFVGTTGEGGAVGPGTTVAGGQRPAAGGGGGATAATTPGGGVAPAAGGGTDPAAPATPAEGGGDAGAAAGPNEASDVGVTESTIKFGTIVAENGVLGDAFAPVARGLRAWVEDVNAAGGLNGRTVELVTCDDREDRAQALECARRLVEQDQVFAVFTNTRALGGASEYLAEQGIPVLGIPITNGFYRWPNFFSLYGGPYVRNGAEVGHQEQIRSRSGYYRWFRDTFGVDRAAVVTYDIAESAQAGAFIAQGLELEGFTVDRYTVSFAAPSFDQVVADMQRNGTTVVFDGLDDGANRRFCDTITRRGLELNAKVSTIVVMGESIGTEYPEACRNAVFVTGLTIAYTDTSVPIVARFREAYDRYQPGEELHQWAFEGFLLGEVLAEQVVAMGPAPTRAGVIERLNGRNAPVVFQGALLGDPYQPVDFAAERVEHCLTIARWQDSAGGWVQATTPFPLCYPDAFQFFSPVSERGD